MVKFVICVLKMLKICVEVDNNNWLCVFLSCFVLTLCQQMFYVQQVKLTLFVLDI